MNEKFKTNSLTLRIGTCIVGMSLAIIISMLISSYYLTNHFLREITKSMIISRVNFFEGELRDNDFNEAVTEIEDYLRHSSGIDFYEIKIATDDHVYQYGHSILDSWLSNNTNLNSGQFYEYESDTNDYLIYYKDILILSELTKKQERYLIYFVASNEVYEAKLFVVGDIEVGIAIFISIVIISLTIYVTKSAIKPLYKLTNQMQKISDLNVDKFEEIDLETVPAEMRSFSEAWNKMLRRLTDSSKQQARFIADASHELRTPIATMKSCLQLSCSRERELEYYKIMSDDLLSEVNKMDNTVKNLLLLARIDAGEISYEESDLNEIVSRVVEQFRAIYPEHNIVYSSLATGTLVRVNQNILTIAISNLIHNAAIYGGKDKFIQVVLKADAEKVTLSVCDNGGNISLEEKDLIFERFYRGHSSQELEVNGSGIGLCIVHEVIRKHNGWVELDVEPSKSTRFKLNIPKSKTDF